MEGVQFGEAGGLAGTELGAPIAHQVQRRDALGDARRMVIVGRQQADSRSEADTFGALAAGGKEALAGRGVRVLFEEVMLDLPQVVDSDAVAKLDLLEPIVPNVVFRVGVPRLWKLKPSHESGFHRCSPL